MLFKKIFSLLTAVVLCLTVSSCGKGEEEQTADTAVIGKKIVKVYTLSAGDEFKDNVNDFNKNSVKYTVRLTEYAEEYPDDPILRFSSDIIAGNVPDLFLLDSYSMPVESYVAKGLFADIYGYMDNDSSFNRGDYLENYFEAYETAGKLYSMSPCFSIQTVVGKASVVGEARCWTMDEFITFAGANPDKNLFEGIHTKSGVLTSFVNSGCGNFFNVKTGKCSFDGKDFIKLLEFCNSFPYEIPEDYYENIDMNEYEAQWRNGDTLLDFCLISNFTSIRRCEAVIFGEPVTVKGYPSENSSGLSFNNYGSEMAIAANAENGDGAWEFLKYFLSDEYQDKSHMFPIKLSALKKKAEASKERPFVIGDNGEKYYTDMETAGGTEIIIGANTDEDIIRVTEIIGSADSVWRYDSRVTAVINEEAAAYFAGQRPAAETAEIIQNRVQNYLNEQM